MGLGAGGGWEGNGSSIPRGLPRAGYAMHAVIVHPLSPRERARERGSSKGSSDKGADERVESQKLVAATVLNAGFRPRATSSFSCAAKKRNRKEGRPHAASSLRASLQSGPADGPSLARLQDGARPCAPPYRATPPYAAMRMMDILSITLRATYGRAIRLSCRIVGAAKGGMPD